MYPATVLFMSILASVLLVTIMIADGKFGKEEQQHMDISLAMYTILTSIVSFLWSWFYYLNH